MDRWRGLREERVNLTRTRPVRLKYCSDFLFSIFRQFNCSVVVCDDERGDFLKRGTRRRKLVTIEGIGYDTFSSTEYSFY